LWTIIVILLILWLLGFSFHVGGGLIHIIDRARQMRVMISRSGATSRKTETHPSDQSSVSVYPLRLLSA
jgi:hypothetical protein